MQVEKIIKNTAELLSLKNVIDYLEDDLLECDEDTTEDMKNLLIAVNMTNNNIASNYIELVGEMEVEVETKKIDYNAVSSKAIIEIKSIVDEHKVLVDYQITPDGIVVRDKGKYKIVYSFFPDSVDMDDEINYYLKLNDLLFAQGVAGEYLFIKGAIDDAYMWDRRFKQSMLSLLRPKRNIEMPAKRWV